MKSSSRKREYPVMWASGQIDRRPTEEELIAALQVMAYSWHSEETRYGRGLIGLGDDICWPGIKGTVNSVADVNALLRAVGIEPDPLARVALVPSERRT